MSRFSNSENVGGFMNRATAWWRPRGKWCNPVCADDAPLMEPLTRMVASLIGMRKMNSMFTCRPCPASQYVVLGCRIHSWMFVGFLLLQYLIVLLGALTRNYTKFPMLFNWLDWRHRESNRDGESQLFSMHSFFCLLKTFPNKSNCNYISKDGS